MKVAIFGAGGLLGRSLVKELEATGDLVTKLPRSACDIGDPRAVLQASRDHDALVNAAAYTDVDGAEGDEHAAYRANALGAENLARAAEQSGATLLHVSTDFVFDGAKPTPYDELDAPAPIGIYGRSKWAGEELAKAACRRLALVRVQALYGDGGRNFASRLRGLLLKKTPFTVDAERQAQPTWVRTAARAIAEILRLGTFGTYHVSSRGRTSWAGFAERMAAGLGLPVEGAFTAVPTAALATKATRPVRALFSHRLTELRGIAPLPTWEEDLARYLAAVEGR